MKTLKSFFNIKTSESGAAHILGIILILVGIGVGIYLVQNPQILRSRASNTNVSFAGASITTRDGQSYTSSPTFNLKLTSPIQALPNNSGDGVGGQISPPGNPDGGTGGRSGQEVFRDPFNNNKYGLSFLGKDGQDKMGLPTPIPAIAYGVGGLNGLQILQPCEVGHSPCVKRSGGRVVIVRNKDDNDFSASEVYKGQNLTKGEKQFVDIVSRTRNTYWMLFNEPDLWMLPDSDIPEYTPAQLAQAYKRFYDLVKLTNTNGQVALGGVATVVPLYKDLISQTLASYRAQYGTSMPVDMWNFHSYPIKTNASCEDEDVYQAGLLFGKQQAWDFVHLVNTSEGGAYRNAPIWLTEWGWIRNPENGAEVSKNVNSPCVSRYIRDYIDFLENDFTVKNEITRSMYFPAGHETVDKAYWCDHFYGRFLKDKSKQAQFITDKPDWQCWAGFLTEEIRVSETEKTTVLTEPGKMYGCMATKRNKNLCPLPTTGASITETRIFETLIGGDKKITTFRDCSVELPRNGVGALGDMFGIDPNPCKNQYIIKLDDSRYGGGVEVNNYTYYMRNNEHRVYQALVGVNNMLYVRDCALDTNRGPWALGDPFNKSSGCPWRNIDNPVNLSGAPIYGAREVYSTPYKRGNDQRIYEIIVSGNGKKFWYRDCAFNANGGQTPADLGNGFADGASCPWLPRDGYSVADSRHGGEIRGLSTTAYQLGPMWRASEVLLGSDNRFYFRDCEFDPNKGPSSLGDGFASSNSCRFFNFEITEEKIAKGIHGVNYIVYPRMKSFPAQRASASGLTEVLGIVNDVYAQSTSPTRGFKIAESDLTDAGWNSIAERPYTGEGMEVQYSLSNQSPGAKRIYIQFISADGRKEVKNATIIYEPSVSIAGYVYLDGNGNAGFDDGENSRTHASIINNVEVRYTSQQDNSITGTVRTQNDSGNASGFYQVNIPQNARNHVFTVRVVPPNQYRNAGEQQYGVNLGGSSKTQHIGIAPAPMAACGTVSVPLATNGILPSSVNYPTAEVSNVQKASRVQFYLYKGSVSQAKFITEMPQETITGSTYKRTLDFVDLKANKGINTSTPLVVTAIAVDAAGQQTSCGQTTISISAVLPTPTFTPTPITRSVTPTSTSTPAPQAAVTLVGYTLSEDITIRDASTAPQVQTSSPTGISYKLSGAPGTKTIFVRFFYSNGTTKDFQQSILYKGSASTPTTSTGTQFTEGFNSLNSTNSLGNGWVAQRGTFGIQNSQGYISSGCPAPGVVVRDGSLNGAVEVKLVKNKQDARVIFRYQDLNNYYIVEAQGNGYALKKISNGTSSTLGTINTPLSDGDVIKVETNGANIQVFLNSSKVIDVSDSSINGTKVGFGTWCDTSMRFDDFSFTSR